MKKLVDVISLLFALPFVIQAQNIDNVRDLATSLKTNLASMRINDVRMADQFSGADPAAKINAAIADLPASGGTVDAHGFNCGTLAFGSTQVKIPANVWLRLSGCNTITGSNSTAMFLTNNSGTSASADYGGGIIQDPGGVIQYTGPGAAILLNPGGAGNFISGFTIDIDTIDCNDSGAYGIQFAGAGWTQRTVVRFRHIWHFTGSGLDFQLGRKNGAHIDGIDIDGQNVAGKAELGVHGIYFEDSSDQAGYNLYEANDIHINSVRNTQREPVLFAPETAHNYLLLDSGNDFGHNNVHQIKNQGAHNTIILRGTLPWFDFTSISGAVTYTPTVWFDSSNSGNDNVLVTPSFVLSGLSWTQRTVTVGQGIPIQETITGPEQMDDILLNGSFEDSDGTAPIGWSSTHLTRASGLHTDAVTHGTRSYAMVSDGAGAAYLSQSLATVFKGKTVTACGWFWWLAGISGSPAISIKTNSAENYMTLPTAYAADNVWHHLCVPMNTGPGVSSLEVDLYADKSGNATNTVLVDGVCAVQGALPCMAGGKPSPAIGTTVLAKNVGIGTAAPHGPLDVNNGIWVDSSNSLIFNGSSRIDTNLATQSLTVESGTSSTLYLNPNGGTVSEGSNTQVFHFLNGILFFTPISPPSCGVGQYYIYADRVSNKLRKCNNGLLSDL
jgi:hypothetical protein